MDHKIYYQKVVVITGGSSGIGLALAQEFAHQKAHLVLLARDHQKLLSAKHLLQQIAGNHSNIEVIPTDITNREEVFAAIQTIGSLFGKIDVLINCAGTITCGRFADQTEEDLHHCFSTNYLGALYTTKAAWPLLKRAKGQLSFVSSVAGYIGLIGYSSYAPSKFALAGLAECLRMEGKDEGISVSVIYPPDTDTPFLRYERQHTIPECRALSKTIKTLTAAQVAKTYLHGLSKNKFEIYCDNSSKLVRWFKNNFPTVFYYLTEKVIAKAKKDTKYE